MPLAKEPIIRSGTSYYFSLGVKMAKKGEEIKQKILEYLANCQNGAATGEITSRFGLTRSQAVYYLTKLVLDGKVMRKLKSPRVALWYLVKKES